MIGAIIGDMVGSIYEFQPIKTKDFSLKNPRMRMTDDSYLTMSVARVLMKNYPIKYDGGSLEKIKKDLIDDFILTWQKHPDAGFGGMFYNWCVLSSRGNSEPYNSFGNGSAMRISPVGWVANTEEEVKILSKAVTEITHNHPEGIKGAEAVAMCIYLARKGFSKEQIKERMVKDYYPEIKDLSFEELKKTYEFSEICQKSVPQAIYCFLISNGLEDAIRNCVGIGGDCDTTGAMAGAIAEAYYKNEKSKEFIEYFSYYFIDPDVEKLVKDFHDLIGR